ncbi:MAG: extracellular solute-binding protein [Truepera sp.]|nr:extracellular solute-binding protein [Truepera sp.]
MKRLLVVLFLLVWGLAAAQTSLRVVIAEYSGLTGPFFQDVAADFQRAHPDIEVRIEVVPWDLLFMRLTTDIAGGRAPDISIIGTRWLAEFVAEGLAEPLDAFMTDAFRGQFIEAFLTPSILDGKTYGLPVAASVRAFYYNKDLFEAAGITEPPVSWDELREAARRIVEETDAFGFGLQGGEIEADVYWYYALWTFGGDILTDDGQSGINSPEAVAAAEFYRQLIRDGLTQPGPTAYGREDLQELFKAGRLGMMITGPWFIGHLAAEAPDLNYGVAALPFKERPATMGVTDTIMMFSTSRAKEAAWQFLEFAFQPEYRFRFTQGEGMLPVLKAVAEDLYFAEHPRLGTIVDLLPHARFAPIVPEWERIADITVRALQLVYLEQAPPEQALNEAAEQINRILGR